jgi:penicillin-binding protein 1A
MADNSRSRPARDSRRPAADRPPAQPWYRRRWALALIVPAVLVIGAVGLFVLTMMVRIPLPDDIAPIAATVFDGAGNEVGTLTGDSAREDTTLDRLPEHVPLAVLAAEDRGFYSHGAVSPLGIARAMWVNLRAGSVEQGGSTVTQQYVKNAAVGSERTFTRKIKEAALAIKLERKYDKQTILEWYLNTVYWGRGAQGIGAAAQTYFGVPADQLDLNQAATLAGMIQAPENLDPADAQERADARRRYVLDGMLKEGWISQAEHDQTVAAGLPEVGADTARQTMVAPYYMDAVRSELQAELGPNALTQGLHVYTALDVRLQQEAERIVAETVANSGLAADDLSGAVVSVQPDTGNVIALVGGTEYASQPFNVAISGERQIGSTFKAFTVGAFTEAGLSPLSEFDAPAVIDVPDHDTGIHDYANQDRGRLNIYEATAVSANTVFVQMQQEVGADTVADTASRLGLPAERDGQRTFSMGSSMTLGVDEFTPLEVAEAYNTINAGGVHVAPRTIVRVEDGNGNVVWEPSARHEPVMDTNDALIVTDVLKSVVTSGTGGRAALGRPVAGKTGTTQGGADGWFAGYTPQLTTVAWIGRLGSNQPVEGLSGGGVPTQLWHDVMAVAMEGVEPADWSKPSLDGYDERGRTEETEAACPEGWQRGTPEDLAPPATAGPDGELAAPTVEVLPGTEEDPEGPCIRIVEVSPTPTDAETTETETPTETEMPTELPLPTESPTGGESPSPTPTETPTGGNGDGGAEGGKTGEQTSPSPSPTPTSTTSTTSTTSPSPTPTASETSTTESPSPTESP